jgi:hypothetical protein
MPRDSRDMRACAYACACALCMCMYVELAHGHITGRQTLTTTCQQRARHVSARASGSALRRDAHGCRQARGQPGRSSFSDSDRSPPLPPLPRDNSQHE